MRWQDHMRPDEREKIAQYDETRTAYKQMQTTRNLIRNRCLHRMKKSKNITQNSACDNPQN